jgi:hypothetical protein
LPSGVTENPAASTVTIHADQVVRHFGDGRNGSANALRLSTKIGVECTQDDTSIVCSFLLMKAEKVAAIVGEENPALSDRERQNFRIRHGGIRFSGIQRRDDVMSQPPQFRDDLRRDIFVGIEMGHSLRGFVLADLRLDFLSVRARVGPSVHEILGTQIWVGRQQGLLAGTETPGLLEKPNGNPRSHDARLAAAHVRARVDTWKIVVKLPNHPLEDLRFLPAR